MHAKQKQVCRKPKKGKIGEDRKPICCSASHPYTASCRRQAWPWSPLLLVRSFPPLVEKLADLAERDVGGIIAHILTARCRRTCTRIRLTCRGALSAAALAPGFAAGYQTPSHTATTGQSNPNLGKPPPLMKQDSGVSEVWGTPPPPPTVSPILQCMISPPGIPRPPSWKQGYLWPSSIECIGASACLSRLTSRLFAGQVDSTGLLR